MYETPRPLRDVARVARSRFVRGFQLASFRSALDALEPARILRFRTRILERIDAGRRRDLVEEALVAERVLHPPRRADPRRPERRFGEPVRGRLDVRKRVRDRERLVDVARGAAPSRRQVREVRREQRRPRSLLRPVGDEDLGLPRRRRSPLRVDRAAVVEQASAAPSDPSRARPRGSTARAPACRSPSRSAPRRPRRPRGRCGRSSPSPRGRCSARSSASCRACVASCLRSRCVACEAVQTVSLPSLNSATAHDGPIEPWVWIAKS